VKKYHQLLLLAVSIAIWTPLTLPAAARPITTVAVVANDNSISAFELVSRGYQGRYRSHGISEFSSFLQEIRWGRMKASKLVAAAIAVGDLPAPIGQDEGYLNQVENQLWRISR
jgi:hypothetical protein